MRKHVHKGEECRDKSKRRGRGSGIEIAQDDIEVEQQGEKYGEKKIKKGWSG